MTVYPASRIKRRRATKDEMEVRARFLIDYANAHGPVNVRQLYYQSVVVDLPGIEKTDAGYDKIQRQVLKLRREDRLSYEVIADATRWMRKPRSHDRIQDAILSAASTYRRNLWRDADEYVEVWIEKDALAGVIYPVTAKYDVPLMVTRGFSSETFCFEAVQAREGDMRPYVVYYLGDFDRAGQDGARSLHEKLNRFAAEHGIRVEFNVLGVTLHQIADQGLPTRPHKRKSPADKRWPHPFACELDAMPPDVMRELVEDAINGHIPERQLIIEREAERSEREFAVAWARQLEVAP